MVDIIVNTKQKKKVKRLSSSSNVHYYPSAFITKPCDQLFGPQPLDCSIDKKQKDKSFNSLFSDNNTDDLNVSNNSSMTTTLNTSSNDKENATSEIPIMINANMSSTNSINNMNTVSANCNINVSSSERFDYIPAPKWNKIQNAMLEELFKKSRYPKPNELKTFAQRFHVMDSDIEEWFRKRRGRDRKTRRKNEALKNLIDNYLDK